LDNILCVCVILKHAHLHRGRLCRYTGFPIEYLHPFELLVCECDHTYLSVRWQREMYSSLVYSEDFLGTTKPRIYRILHLTKSIIEKSFSKMSIVFFVFLCLRREIEHYHEPHSAKATKYTIWTHR
jgi:hypothetical protein